MADGKVYSSKRGYYRSVREQGFEIMGSEPPKYRQPEAMPSAAADLAQVMRERNLIG